MALGPIELTGPDILTVTHGSSPLSSAFPLHMEIRQDPIAATRSAATSRDTMNAQAGAGHGPGYVTMGNTPWG